MGVNVGQEDASSHFDHDRSVCPECIREQRGFGLVRRLVVDRYGPPIDAERKPETTSEIVGNEALKLFQRRRSSP